MLFLLFAALDVRLMSAFCQTLKTRTLEGPKCPPVEIRLVAKHDDGSPFSDLSPTQIEVTFSGGPIDLISLKPFSWKNDTDIFTDILFVVPPLADSGIPLDVKAVVSALSQHDDFSFRAAVLSPDGVTSSFTSDIRELQSALSRAITVKETASLEKWTRSELGAFLALRRLGGRHVIVRIFAPNNPHNFAAKTSISQDRTLEIAASFDLAPLYMLQPAIDGASSIPGGDASGNHVDSYPDSLGLAQSLEMQDAADAQATLWSQRFNANRATAGRTEPSVEALIYDVLNDAAGSYDLVVQPRYACPGQNLRPILIQPTVKHLYIFGPSAIQMMPYQKP